MGVTDGTCTTVMSDKWGSLTFYRGADAARPAGPVQVLHGVLRGPQVVDMADSRQVQAAGCLGGGYQQAALVVPEGVQRLQPLITLRVISAIAGGCSCFESYQCIS